MTNFVQRLQTFEQELTQSLPQPLHALVQAKVAELVQDLEQVYLSPRHQVVTSIAPAWRDPDVVSAPIGRKITVMNWGGIQIETIGSSSTAEEFAAWAPLIDKPEWLARKLQAYYQRNQTPY